jgi:hypothetical protein
MQAEYETKGFIARNCRDVWRINPRPYKGGAHFATFPGVSRTL